MKNHNTLMKRFILSAGLLVLTFGMSSYGASPVSPSGPCTTLDMHPFLYAGEFQKQSLGGNEYFDNQKVYLVKGGKIAWTYLATIASTGGKLVELGDISMKADGHIVMSLGWGGAREIIPDYNDPAHSKIVWTCKAEGQVHTAQPVGPDKVFVIDNSPKPKAKLYDIKTGAVLRTWDLPTVGTDAHAMFRHCRMTKAGTLLIAHMNMAKVVEYDATTMKPIWSVEGMPHCWAAVRLKNGNTLVSGNEDKYVREVNPAGTNCLGIQQERSARRLPDRSGQHPGMRPARQRQHGHLHLAGQSLHFGGHAGKEDRLDVAKERFGQFVFDPFAR